MTRHRINIVLVKRDRPKRVTLPNGKTFLAQHKRVSKGALPPNVTIKRTNKQRAAPRKHRRGAPRAPRNRRGRGVGKIFKFAKK